MTEAKRDSWSRDGEKADFKIEVLIAVAVCDDAASAVAEEIFGATLADFLLTIMMVVKAWPGRQVNSTKTWPAVAAASMVITSRLHFS